jgi:hypothetical protein
MGILAWWNMVRDNPCPPGQGGSIRMHKAWRKIIILAKLGKNLGGGDSSTEYGVLRTTCVLVRWAMQYAQFGGKKWSGKNHADGLKDLF